MKKRDGFSTTKGWFTIFRHFHKRANRTEGGGGGGGGNGLVYAFRNIKISLDHLPDRQHFLVRFLKRGGKGGVQKVCFVHVKMLNCEPPLLQTEEGQCCCKEK